MHVHWPGLIAMINPGRLPCSSRFAPLRDPVQSWSVNSAQTTLPVSRPASGCQPQLSL